MIPSQRHDLILKILDEQEKVKNFGTQRTPKCY